MQRGLTFKYQDEYGTYAIQYIDRAEILEYREEGLKLTFFSGGYSLKDLRSPERHSEGFLEFIKDDPIDVTSATLERAVSRIIQYFAGPKGGFKSVSIHPIPAQWPPLNYKSIDEYLKKHDIVRVVPSENSPVLKDWPHQLKAAREACGELVWGLRTKN